MNILIRLILIAVARLKHRFMLFRLWLCRSCNIHIARKTKVISLNINATSIKLQQSTTFRFHATHCCLCQKRLSEEPIPQKLFNGYRTDSVWPNKEAGEVIFRQSI